jgi:hypothetical protein
LLESLGIPPGRSPSVATLHRVFKALDVAAFERVVGEWLAQTGVAPTDPLALDGKSLRGIHGDEVAGVPLVAAYAHDAQAVVAQLPTGGKGQEPAAAKAVLGQVPLEGRLVTADALLTQREVSEGIMQGGGFFPGGRPEGLGEPLAPPWVGQELAAQGGRVSEVREVEPKVRQGRREARMRWVLYDPSLNRYAGSGGEQGTPWPGLAQVWRVERRRTRLRRGQPVGGTQVEISYYITSAPPERMEAGELLRRVRGHWIRDVDWDEDLCQVRTGAAPQVLAACRNLAQSLPLATGV